MKNPEMTETLIRAIQSYAEYYLVEHDESDLYDRLSGLFNLSDADLDAIGLAWVIPKSNEPPKKTFKIHVREVWEGDINVEAENEEDALDLIYGGALYSTTDDLSCTDWTCETSENE